MGFSTINQLFGGTPISGFRTPPYYDILIVIRSLVGEHEDPCVSPPLLRTVCGRAQAAEQSQLRVAETGLLHGVAQAPGNSRRGLIL